MLSDNYAKLAQKITPFTKSKTVKNLLSELISILFKIDDNIDIAKKQYNFDSLILYNENIKLLYSIDNFDFYIDHYIKSTYDEDNFYLDFDISSFIESKVYNSGIFLVVYIINIELDIPKIYYNEIIYFYAIIISVLNDIISFNKESNEINPFNLFHICRYHNFKYQHILLSAILGTCIASIEFYSNANKELCEICNAICVGYAEWADEANRYQVI